MNLVGSVVEKDKFQVTFLLFQRLTRRNRLVVAGTNLEPVCADPNDGSIEPSHQDHLTSVASG